MAGAVLPADKRGYLLAMMRRQMNSAVRRRMNVLLLLDDAWPVERIAEALFIDAETVRQVRLRYASAGIKGLETLRCRGPDPALSQAPCAVLEAELERTVYMTATAVCHFVGREFGIAYTPNAMTRLLKRLGYVYQKPKCVPAKADAAVQQRFYDETLAPLLRQAGAEQPLYFVDGMHPSYTGHPAYGCIRRGTDRELKSNHGRVNVNINGALRWPERELVYLEAEKITSAAMIALFERLQARHPNATAINLVIDNASYNRSTAVKDWLARDGCRIRLVYLPVYAPNLNLIERLWLLLKKTALWNQHHTTFGAFRAASSGLLDNLNAHPDQLASLIADKFRFIGVSKPRVSVA
jgi:transposase